MVEQSGGRKHVPQGTGLALGSTMFGQLSLSACAEWLWSGYALKHPNIKIAMSEGGIAWVPGLIDRLNHVAYYQHIYGTWAGIDITPTEVFHRNFWHCVLDDPANMRLVDVIGNDRVMIEADYPHLDSSWPNTQAVFERQLTTATEEQIRRVTWQNASELFRHPVPASVVADPDSF